MKNRVLSAIALALILQGTLLTFSVQQVKSSSPLPVAFDVTFGGSADDYGESVFQTSDGGYAVAGGTFSYGSGSSDFWLVKTDAAGGSQWTQTYGGSGWDVAESVVQTNDGGYALTGTTMSYGGGSADFWLVKTAPNTLGNLDWNQTYGSTTYETASAGIQTSDGGYALIGGNNDLWLVKTQPATNGIQDWTAAYGGAGHDWGTGIAQTSSGYVLAGYTDSVGSGLHDFYLVNTDAFGASNWEYAYGGSGEDWCYSVDPTTNGGYILAGETNSFGSGDYDVYLVKVDPSGSLEWSFTFGGPLDDGAASVVQTSDGGYILVGWTQSFGAGGWDTYVVKTDSYGNFEWEETFGGTGDDWGNSIIETSDGGYVLAGATASKGAGGFDFSLIKLGPVEPERALDKSMSDTRGYSGEVITVTINITVPPGETATVEDILPNGLKYVVGSFQVNGNPQTPTINYGPPQRVSITLTSGTYTITFEVRITSDAHPRGENHIVTNVANAKWQEGETQVDEKTDTVDFTIVHGRKR
jgi:uncharacterized repeat protein (TIGR01451 family)